MFHSVSVLDGYMIYVVGAGDDGKGVLRFDTDSSVWSTLGATSSNKHGSASFVVGGCSYVAGGEVRSSVKRYDVANTGTWTAVADMMLEGRYYFHAVTIGSADPAEEQDLFDSLIAKAARDYM
jgi:hypothetical protein